MMKGIGNNWHLIYQLVVKELKVRYMRSSLGFLWVFISPFLIVMVFYLVFFRILRINIEGYPFFLYLMTGIFPWNFFQCSLISSTTSLWDNRNLIKEAKLPQYVVPLSVIVNNLIIFLPSLFITIILSSILLNGLSLSILFLPFILFIHFLIALGLSLILSLLYLKYRDTKYILEVLLSFIFYLTPVFYPLSLVKDAFPLWLFRIYYLNPFVGVLNLYRYTLLKGFYISITRADKLFSLVIIPLIFTISILFLGIYYYRKNKDKINDYLAY
ncbi:MAG: ABC transporter permease [Candidatus Omnitrophica bacterium]|nr:ABC transporter permease [Candidatus Omnitrophota bacterium]MCM8827198.1 ABC transporter permease [Candidatus Omnitrophota bacterium]